MANAYTIKSHTNPSLSYTVTFPDEGEPYCQCKGYGYRRTCSHIVEARQLLTDSLLQALHATGKALDMYFCHVCGLELKGTHTYTGLCPSCTKQQVLTAV